MGYQIDVFEGNYSSSIIFPIWDEALPGLGQRRIDWTYIENIYSPPKIYVLKTPKENEYVGCATVFPREFYINGKRQPGGMTGDFAFKKKYRSLGPALSLQKHILKEENKEKTLLSFPNDSAVKLQLRAGFKNVGEMILYVKPFEAKFFFNNKFLSFFSPLINLILRIKDIGWPVNKKKFRTIETDKLDARIDRLWEEMKKLFNFIATRNSVHIKWRYLDNPYKKYRLFLLEEKKNKKLKNCLIYTISEGKVFVDDFLWDGDTDAFIILLRFFSNFCREKRYNSLYIQMIMDSKIDAFLIKSGFYKKPANRQLLTNISMNMEEMEGSLFVTKGDDDF